MRNQTIQVLSANDDVTRNGIQIDADQIITASFHLVLSDATGAGTFKIQASNDIGPTGQAAQNFTVTNWVDIPSATVTQTAGNKQALITLATTNYRWMRAVWTQSTGGSGTLTVNMNSNGV
jgi:hypothetical protein